MLVPRKTEVFSYVFPILLLEYLSYTTRSSIKTHAFVQSGCYKSRVSFVFHRSQSFLFNGSSLCEMNYLASLKQHSKIPFGCQTSKGVVKKSTKYERSYKYYDHMFERLAINLKRNTYIYSHKQWLVIFYVHYNLKMIFEHTNIARLLFLPHLTLNLPWNIIIGQQTSHNVIWRYGAKNLKQLCYNKWSRILHCFASKTCYVMLTLCFFNKTSMSCYLSQLLVVCLLRCKPLPQEV